MPAVLGGQLGRGSVALVIRGTWGPWPSAGSGRGGPACPVLPMETFSLYFEPNNMDFIVRVWTVLRSPHKHYPLLLTLAPFLSSFWTVFFFV